MRRVFEGLQILLKYNSEGYFCAQHDQIFTEGAGRVLPENISEEDKKVLKDNGWFWEHGSWTKFV